MNGPERATGPEPVSGRIYMSLTETPADNGAVEVAIATGKRLACLVCAHELFRKRRALLNTRTATFFKLDWANAAATNLVCMQCGYVHWFLNP
jgi:hypothetical protein